MDEDPVDAACDVGHPLVDNPRAANRLLVKAKQLGKLPLRQVNLVGRVNVNDDAVKANVKVQGHDVVAVSVFASFLLNAVIKKIQIAFV